MCQIGPAGSGSWSSKRSEKYYELQHFPPSSSDSSSNLFFPPTETNHCGPPVVQRGALPALFGGATGEHHQWRCPHGWLFVHARWSQRAHRGWVQFCAPGSSGPSVWVYGQCKCLAYHCLLLLPQEPLQLLPLHHSSGFITGATFCEVM